MVRDKLEELSHELSDRERQDLLRKIGAAQAVAAAEPIKPVELVTEERARLIEQDLLQIGWVTRALIWIQSLLTGRDRTSVFVGVKVREIKSRVRQVNPYLTGFESRDLGPRFAELVFDVFRQAAPLVDMCRALTREPDLQAYVYGTLLERAYPGSKKSVEDLVPMEDLERTYAQKASVDEIRRQVLGGLGDYLKALPAELVAGLESRIQPLLQLERIVLFSYGSLFRYFNYVVREPIPSDYPPFDRAPAMLLIDHMERLLHGIHLAQGVPDDWRPPADLVKLYLQHRTQTLPAGELERETRRIQAAVVRLSGAVRVLATKLPLLDLIRYFRRDPYYRLEFAAPTLSMVAAYSKWLRVRFFDELREKLDSIKLRAVERRTDEFFRGPIRDLDHYNNSPEFDFRRLGLPYFSFTRSLRLLSNYLGRMYKGFVREVVQLANTTILATNKLLQNRLSQADGQLLDVETRIAHFDRGMAPDEEDGKALFALRYNVASDALQQRYYRAFIADKDRQARSLLEKAQAGTAEVLRVLEEIVSSPTENLKAVLRSTQVVRGKSQTLLSLVTSRRDNVKVFLEILEQTAIYEKGS